ncbi:gamma carbonic anhydrase family protein [uncultured Umboniibacter sp.]|uniref:gamma carbonic anhydrase family protein n=1 Tax=uncultured Umboniibacter sp. TaxID=1798917 RepID=UPI00261BC2B3|nr:gamma carbonic anhydrase family protein [uncultured Umboniibacter sp.]
MLFKLGGKSPLIYGEQHFIAPTAALIGEVVLHPRSSVWFSAVIRADNALIEVGEDSNIQDGSVLHTDAGIPLRVGRGVTVGHQVMLHGCEIGDYSLIGINTTILNGAKIGKSCIIGANSLVTEGADIPDFSLVMGSPAKVIRQLDPSTYELLKASADHYVDNAERYLDQLEEIL